MCDIYAFAMQEAQPLNLTLLIGSTDNLKKWDEIIEREFTDFVKKINPNEKYHKEKMVHFGGLYLSVFTSSLAHSMIDNVGEFAAGFKAFLKNKGACGITMRIGEERICFINCHLTAFQEKVRERVENVQEITKMKFTDSKMNTYTIPEHDFIFWAGDMNFRIGNLMPEHVREHVLNKNLDFLLEKDQVFANTAQQGKSKRKHIQKF